MKDPIRWQDTTELERQLLEAARRDAATPALRAKMAQALSSLPPPAASASATTAASHARLLFSHPALWGSLCAVIVAGALRWQSSSQTTPTQARARQSGEAAALPRSAVAPAPAATQQPRSPAAPATAITQQPLSAATLAVATAQASAGAPATATTQQPLSAAVHARAAAPTRSADAHAPAATPTRGAAAPTPAAAHQPLSAAAPGLAAAQSSAAVRAPASAAPPPSAAAASTAAPYAARTAALPHAATLREELALLDSARSALAAHDTALAFQLLDRHASQFARAHLTPEAEALRIAAWAQRGETERVERLSRRFLTRHPAHPLAAHVAEIARLH